jgi:hypothetical protein
MRWRFVRQLPCYQQFSRASGFKEGILFLSNATHAAEQRWLGLGQA